MEVSRSKHSVLAPEEKRSRINLILKVMLMNHSPKECAEILYEFLDKHTSVTRVDRERQEHVQKYDNANS